jgi:hypothetical protein
VDHLLETHFPGCQPIMENTARAIPVRTPTEEDWMVASEGVDSEKIRWAIKGFGSFKSAGGRWYLPSILEKWNQNFIWTTG